MAFDFDELDEQLPTELPQFQAMSDADFAQLGARLQSARGFGDFDSAASEALWAAGAAEARMKQLVEELLNIVRGAAHAGSTGAGDTHSDDGCDAMRALFGLSVSMSQDQIAAGVGREGQPVALLFGHAGSHVDELAPQVKFYHTRGFRTIALTACQFPSSLRRYQEVQLAQELRNALVGKAKLIVHMCGTHGHGAWSSLAVGWVNEAAPWQGLPVLQECIQALVWECGPACSPEALSASAASLAAKKSQVTGGAEKPRLSLEEALSIQRELYMRFSSDAFQDKLEDLELKSSPGSAGFVAARNALFLAGQVPVLQKFGFEGNQRGVVDMLQAGARWNGHADYRRNRDRLNDLLGLSFEGSTEKERRLDVAQQEWIANQNSRIPTGGDGGGGGGKDSLVEACLATLLRRHVPEVQLAALLQEYPGVRHFIRAASGAAEVPDRSQADGASLPVAQPMWGPLAEWVEVDVGMTPPVPRLLLCSAQDAISPVRSVEQFAHMMEKYHHGVEISVERYEKAAHMRLWESERFACERALMTLLRRAGFL